MRIETALLALLLALLAFAAPARADEVTVGLYAHDIDTPLNLRGFNEGMDFQLGWRGDRMRALSFVGSPSPHAFVAVNTAGDAHYAAAGIGWKIGRSVYVRPGIGLAVHTADVAPRLPDGRRALGSRVLFAPELALGVQVSDRISIEASLVHLSNAGLLADHNPGIDNFGVRLSYRF